MPAACKKFLQLQLGREFLATVQKFKNSRSKIIKTGKEASLKQSAEISFYKFKLIRKLRKLDLLFIRNTFIHEERERAGFNGNLINFSKINFPC